MIDKFDIQKVSDLPIEQVADALDLKVKRHWALCPFHEDEHPSLYFRVATNKFHCFVCDHYGGPIDLTMKVLNLNFHDAVCWLAQAFGINLSEQTDIRRFANIHPRKVQPVPKEEPHPVNLKALARWVEHPVWTQEARQFLFEERKLDERVIRWCGISSTHTHLLIPYYDRSNRLLSVQWRFLGHDKSQPRFRFPKGSSCSIYNLQILKLLKPNEPLFITEGCSDCWAMLSAGHKAIAIPSATLVKPQDLEPLAGLNLHMYPDNDRPGERLFLQLREWLPTLTRHQLPEGCKDFAEYYLLKC